MERSEHQRGMGLAGSAYVMWGLFPAFFKLLRHTDATRVLAHRALWAALLAAGALALLRRAEWRAFWASRHRARVLATLALTAALLASNWGVYIYAVKSGQVLQASLGYFVCPLVTAALGVAFGGERPGRAQWAALGLAAVGVLQLALRAPALPGLALYLAGSFASYGMLRKRLALEPLLASSVETLLLVPFALAYLVLARPEPLLEVSADGALLVASGLVTAVPLWLFAAGARRLPYVTMGLLSYLTPTLQLGLAVLVYGEALRREQLWALGFICSALLLSSAAASRAWWPRRAKQSHRALASSR